MKQLQEDIKRISYADGLMRVEFRDGKTYDYPASVWQFDALMNAPSKGSHLAKNFSKGDSVAGLRQFALSMRGVDKP
jgi:hypothetical protein